MKDPNNETGTASITFTAQGPVDQHPVARIRYKVDNGVWSAATSELIPIANNSTKVITLDGTTSTDNEGAISSYLWTLNDQLAGVALTKATTSAASLTVNSGTVGVVSLLLTVKDSANQESTAAQIAFEISAPAEVPALYFPQIGVGPMPNGEDELRTVMLIVNDTETDANEVKVEFFAQDGTKLTPLVDGQAWNDAPFVLRHMTSKRFTFTNSQIQVGWGRVTSDTKLFGLVQYQLVKTATEEVMREISLFSSSPARRLVTFFDRDEDIAVAVVNPGDSPAKITVKVIDSNNGETPDLAWHLFPSIPPAGLEKNKQVARSLERDDVPAWAEQGSLMIESDNEVVVTVLKTTIRGEAFSTLPISITR